MPSTSLTPEPLPGGPARPPLDLRAAALSAAFLVLLVLPALSPWFLFSFSAWFILALAAAAGATGLLAPDFRYGAVPLLGGVLAAALALLWGVDSLLTVYNGLITGVVFGAFPWLLAGAWARHRRSVAREWEALERAEESRRHEAEAARMRERNAIAEELHDDLGHSLSLVALNLGRLELSPELGEEHREAVTRARREVGEAVERLGASVELLRGDAPPPAEPPADGIAGLVANAREAGARIEVEDEPGAERLAEFGAAGVHRVVREGLTNALKHAPGQPVLIRFAGRGGSLAVTVRNPAPAPAGPRPGGSGLAALRERVRALGGTMSAGHGGGAFTLEAVLPLGADRPAGAPPPEEPADEEPRLTAEMRGRLEKTRRRSALRFGAALAAPVAAVALVAAAAQAVNVREASRSLLSPAAYDAIALGDDRAATEALLPAHQADVVDPDPPPGECRYHAVTADPLDDAFGDSYRICFTGDRVSAKDLLTTSAP
ncbi:sensor histidine kinase [Nocardiopsis potens]|uniref:sensor histidine kinase n=1 Tax=Nocardiopsis potens TaxID=1246458 RepID=UPI00034651A3|nr:histidine kinase [Nocardiopsis potens]